MLKSYARSVAYFALTCSLPPITLCYVSKIFGRHDRLTGIITLIIGAMAVLIEPLER